MLARQPPWWEPGTAVTTTSLSATWSASWCAGPPAGPRRVLRRGGAGPLDAEFHIGTGPEHDGRVSLLIQGSPDEGVSGGSHPNPGSDSVQRQRCGD
jgi:hypothetical protein